METKVGPLCSQDWKIQQKEVSRHYLTPEMVPGKIRHFLVASFYCSANIYDNTCLALYTRTIPYSMCVWRTPGTVHENDTYHILNTYEYYVVRAIGAAVALPWSLVGEIKVGKIKEPQSGTITFGLTVESESFKTFCATFCSHKERTWGKLRKKFANFHFFRNFLLP